MKELTEVIKTITDSSEAILDKITDEAYTAAWGLIPADRAAAFAVMVAALRFEGWTGEAARDVLAVAMDGYSGPELAQAGLAADSISNPWRAWSEIDVFQGSNQPSSEAVELAQASREASQVLRRLLRQNRPTHAGLPPRGGDTLILDGTVKTPRWICEGILARGRTHMLSGAYSAAKSAFREGLMAASLLEQPSLGRTVPKLRWLIIDGENAREDVEMRWHAMGLSQEHLSRVNYVGRERRILAINDQPS